MSEFNKFSTIQDGRACFYNFTWQDSITSSVGLFEGRLAARITLQPVFKAAESEDFND